MTAETTTDTGAAGPGRGRRMSRRRKRDAVLRLLQGGGLELVSLALGVTAATLSGWCDAFLVAGEASLATRPTDGEALENEWLKTKLGEMLLDRELLEAKVAALEAVRAILSAGPFHGEGHRKVWARLRMGGVRTSKRRVLRLMRGHGLLAPSRVGSPKGPRNHDGTIIPERMDAMWGGAGQGSARAASGIPAEGPI